MSKYILLSALLLTVIAASVALSADDTLFSTNLHKKFQAKSCTNCHDFHEKEKNGLVFSTHQNRKDRNSCTMCHNKGVTGFEPASEWFAMPGLYTSGMDAKTTCLKTKEALHFSFKSDSLASAQMEKHLLLDPRVLWGIEGATINSGKLPFNKRQDDMVKGGFEEWRQQVLSWIRGGMKCE